MSAATAIFCTTCVVLAGGIWEAQAHRRNLKKIPIRVHVNGTRGKSSVARLIAAGLRAGGIRTCCKTTGTLPRMILPDGTEYPVFRPARANVIEQVRIIRSAVEFQAEALVIECMALMPHLQWISESKLVRATHAVITNAREDHLDVMGPTERDVAWALAGMIPPGSKLYTAEQDHLDIFQHACQDRRCQLTSVTNEEVDSIHPLELAQFSYVEHAENVALALKVCDDLGVDRATALQGMWAAKPDPGAMVVYEMNFFDRNINFINGFAANDPESTERIWRIALERYPDVERKIAIFNCRADRPDRSYQLGKVIARWPRADNYLLIGSGTYTFARAATMAGIDPLKLHFAEDRPADQVFEMIVELSNRSSMVMGMANIAGIGLDLIRYFANRSRLRVFR